MNKKSGQPVELSFAVYANAIGPKFEALTQFRIKLFSMNKEQAEALRLEVYKNPHVGTATIHLDNGCHI